MIAPYVFISGDELEALEGLPHIVFRLYLCLKQRMDYQTGVVGQKHRISWMGLRSMLYVQEHQGFEESGAPSIGKVRRAMEWLKRQGLVEDLGSKQRGEAIVFRLILAPLDNSEKNKPGMNPARTRQGNPSKKETYKTNAESDTYTPDTEEPGMNPASENSKNPADIINHYSLGNINIPLNKTTLSNPTPKPAPSEQVDVVFSHWQSVMGKKLAKLDSKRKARIEWALKTYGLQAALAAIDGCKNSDWHMGANDRRREFNDLTLIFRDAEHTERFLAKPTTRKSGIQDWLSEDQCIDGDVISIKIAGGTR
ncbi:hypothetical protein HF673_01200 [Acidithiobacillus thiooxidans]|uniref:hypothetical protein n=1 Tax=Acidithiobacillus thiooxidans TaxID=930 RepID=UPI00068BE610|nr:hypothetical protein [Acidithiobacillus thiooxidans]MBU2834432.1 hypothetical protein [Acidithiobacillus thiooxidans]